MASRRNRIVVKPNLKPAAPKSSAATVQKTKPTIITTLPTPSESASIGGKSEITQTPLEKLAVPIAAEAEKTCEKGVVDIQSSGDVDCGTENDAVKQKLNAHLLKKNIVSNSNEEFALDTERHSKSADGSDTVTSVDIHAAGVDNENAATNVAEKDVTIVDADSRHETDREPVISEASTILPTTQHGSDKEARTATPCTTKAPDSIAPEDDDDGEDDACLDQSDAPALSGKAKDSTAADGPDSTIEGTPQPKKQRKKREKKERKEPLPPSDKSPDRHKMKMGDLLVWNPNQNYFPKKKKTPSNTVKKEERPKTPESIVSLDDDEASNQSSSLPAPRVMIGPDGSIVVDTQSLIIETAKEDTDAKVIIEEDDDDRYLNSNSYRKSSKTKMWTEKENEKFFMGLSMCGTDFSLMCNLLPKRSRRELKNKFRREERRNRILIDKALSSRRPYDKAPFEKMAEDEIAEFAKQKADIEIKKQARRRCKQEANEERRKRIKKEKGRAKKRKPQESEDEEDDWGEEPDFEDEDHENQAERNVENMDSVDKGVSKAKKRKVEKASAIPVESQVVVGATEDNNDNNSAPPRGHHVFTPIEENIHQTAVVDEHSRLQSGATATVATQQLSPLRRVQQALSSNAPNVTAVAATGSGQIGTQITNTNMAGSSNGGSRVSTNLNAIPGSAPIRIEMEGVRNPLQGVLIPSHMVPQLAPQLGIPQSSTPMQVLLVQEEGGSGNMVHVYVLPEKDTNNTPFPQVGQGRVAPDESGQGLTLTSPIPSPHPPPRRPSTCSTPTAPASPFSPTSTGQHHTQPFPFRSPPQVPSSSTGNLSDAETSMSTIRNVYGTAMNSLTTNSITEKDRERVVNPSSSPSLSTTNTSDTTNTSEDVAAQTQPLPPPPPLTMSDVFHYNRP